MVYDTAITGGTVVTANERFAGTVAIDDGRIAAVLDPSQSVTADQGNVDVVNLNDVFSGENLSFQVSSSASEVVSASTDGSTLTINPQNGGTAAVSATASNDAGSAQTSFDVEVTLPDAPGAPDGQ